MGKRIRAIAIENNTSPYRAKNNEIKSEVKPQIGDIRVVFIPNIDMYKIEICESLFCFFSYWRQYGSSFWKDKEKAIKAAGRILENRKTEKEELEMSKKAGNKKEIIWTSYDNI